MSNRPVPGITKLSVNGKSNRKWEPTVVQQGFIPCHEKVSSSVQMPRKHAYEKDKGLFFFSSYVPHSRRRDFISFSSKKAVADISANVTADRCYNVLALSLDINFSVIEAFLN